MLNETKWAANRHEGSSTEWKTWLVYILGKELF